MQVGGEASEECVVEGEFAAFETVPEAVWRGAGDAVVYPAWGN